MTGAIAMGSSKITGLGTPTAGTDAATKAYADTMLPLAGGTMTGNITMGSNSLTGLPTPSAASDAATKDYVDTTNASNTAAATSAANAATSETNAATSETNAATSAANALTSANNAAASYDLFDDRFLGAKSSAPSVDNDGDALVIGALYFDSTTDTMKVYGSGGWVSAGSTVNGTSQRKTYAVGTSEGTYTGSTTVFPIAYDAGFIDVYLNGIKLDPDNDFTATNGTSVTLSSAASTADIVDMVAYGTFELANFSIGAANDVNLTGQLDGHVLVYDSSVSDYVPSDQGQEINLGGDGSNDGVSISDGLIEMRTGGSNPAQIDMYCEVSNAHKVSIKAPAHADYSGNVTFTLPASNGTNGQFLQTDGSGNLSYATVAQPSNATTSTAGLMSAADKTKMDGIETGATADQSDAEIKTAYENNSDTNAFTDALQTKLNGIASSADNYASWTISDGSNTEAIASGNTLTIAGGGDTSTAYDSGTNTLTVTTNAPEAFPSGTSMLFQQTAAPTGWTKQTTHNDKALRIVTGSVSTGGSTGFASAMGTPSVSGSVTMSGNPAKGNLSGNTTINGNPNVSGNISSHTLSINQIPSHSHPIQQPWPSGQIRFGNQVGSANNQNTGNRGNNGGHNHGHNFSGSKGNLGGNATINGNPSIGNLAGSLSSSTASINVAYVDFIIANKD